MNTGFVKTHLVVAQILAVAPIAELITLRSIWSAVVAFPVIFALGIYRCRHCKTPLWDKRVIGKRVPVNPNKLDQCGVCARAMFN